MTSTTKSINKKHQDGFTLIEVVIATAIMMVVFVALLGTITFARKAQSVTENKMAFLHIARQHMEPFSSYMYDDNVFKEGETPIYDSIDDEQIERGTYVINKVSNENSKDVTVTLNWIEPSGNAYSITLTSSYSRSLHR